MFIITVCAKNTGEGASAESDTKLKSRPKKEEEDEDVVLEPILTKGVAEVEGSSTGNVLVTRYDEDYGCFIVISDICHNTNVSGIPLPALEPVLVPESRKTKYKEKKVDNKDTNCTSQSVGTKDRSTWPFR